MQITIHWGINQIGGCITEISTATSRVFVDLGDNLPGETNASDEEKEAMVQRIFSQYKKENEAINLAYSQIHDMFQKKNVEYIHTSGHADVKTLTNVIKRMNPRKGIIGIHKEADASLCELEIPQNLKDKVIPDNLTLDNVVIL